MAKSLKSKHRRKMRAQKRLKNDKKVLAKLQETIKNTNVVLTPAMVRFKEKAELVKQEKEAKETKDTSKGSTPMEVNSTKKINALTRLNKTGKFPTWANKRIRGEMMRKTSRLRNNKSGHLTRKRKRR